LEILSSLGGNSGSTKFLKVFSKRYYSIDSKELSARGNCLKIFFDLSMEDLNYACTFAK
jgi:hypothetical protein